MVALLIIGQVLLIAVMLTIGANHFIPFQIASMLLSLILVLVVVNKQEVPEYKLPWILLVTLLPPFGAIIYLIFGNNHTGYWAKKKFRPIAEESAKYQVQDQEKLAELKKIDPLTASHAKYMNVTGGAVLHGAGEIEYYPMGEDLFPSLMRELKKAKKFIFMEYFIVEEGLFWNSILDVLAEKVKEGVEVRFMYDDVGSIGKVPANYVKKLQARGIDAQVFRPFRPIVSVIHNNRDHRKITVIDNKVAFTGGVNLADEYINEIVRFGRWKDNSVMIKGECVRDFTNMFLTLWDLQADRVSDYERYVNEPCSEAGAEPQTQGFAAAYGDGPKPFYLEQVGKNVYLSILETATDYVYITTPYLVCDNELMSAICQTAERGVDVRMITPAIPDKKMVFMITRSNYEPLLKAGVRIYEYTPGFIHAKTFISDDKVATVSTINLDYRSLVHHYECGLWMYRTPVIADIKKDMLSTMEESHEVVGDEAELKFGQKLIKSVLQIFTPLL